MKNKKTEVKSNDLFPVFLKLQNFHTLLVGAGNVGLEKLTALVNNTPKARIKVVATAVSSEFQSLADQHPHVVIVKRPFIEGDLDGMTFVVLATDDHQLHQYIYELAKERGILLNVADTPDLCDVYLGSIVKKGNLKVGISTNGKSPTLAKRLKEVLNECLPEEIEEILDNLHAIRESLKGDFTYKVRKLNELTAGLVENKVVNHDGEASQIK
ncbi:precorrin-2 dehydrogenase/sirohydrochlorin ferrochelatase family protein [Albibacterium indicum]|uniref:precorrin-2 dehydrogenase/sirohydrochlorin ferrochelatase family protein n=1 Tax=Albibacterium indicum TaxID=2292082 RepID=UPI001FE56C4F|nr:bifunctional precorrin-2 dehydrogenase/sirohydrochlorin ferrochelatase [Pedobacter indicus]